MELLVALIWKLVTLFGGAKGIEKLLEDFLMNQPWMPAAAKKYVVPVGALITALVVALTGGVPMQDALQQAVLTAVAIFFVHDHPALTAADTAAWTLGLPADASTGLPGDDTATKP